MLVDDDLVRFTSCAMHVVLSEVRMDAYFVCLLATAAKTTTSISNISNIGNISNNKTFFHRTQSTTVHNIPFMPAINRPEYWNSDYDNLLKWFADETHSSEFKIICSDNCILRESGNVIFPTKTDRRYAQFRRNNFVRDIRCGRPIVLPPYYNPYNFITITTPIRSPMPKSPMPKSPMPKSPMPKSPMRDDLVVSKSRSNMIPDRLSQGQVVQYNSYWGSLGNVNHMRLYHAKQVKNDDKNGHLELCVVAIPSSVEDVSFIKARLNEDATGFYLDTPSRHVFFGDDETIEKSFRLKISESEGLSLAIKENEEMDDNTEVQTQEFLFPGQSFTANNRNFNPNAKNSEELTPKIIGLPMTRSDTYKIGLLVVFTIPIDDTGREFAGKVKKDIFDLADVLDQIALLKRGN